MNRQKIKITGSRGWSYTRGDIFSWKERVNGDIGVTVTNVPSISDLWVTYLIKKVVVFQFEWPYSNFRGVLGRDCMQISDRGLYDVCSV